MPSDRRFKAFFYIDYAHHPTEILATISALRERHPKIPVICVFEPHQQDRFNHLFFDFFRVFSQMKGSIILPVYRVPGRDAPARFSSEELVLKLGNTVAFYAKDFSKAVAFLNKDFFKKKVIVFMGAGPIHEKIRKLLTGL